MVGAPAKKKSAFTKRHLFLHGERVKMLAQGFLDLFFDAAPHLEYFSIFLSSALKRHLLKRHLTLSNWGWKNDSDGVCTGQPDRGKKNHGTFFSWPVAEPKGPFRTKNSTAPESIVFCYRRSFLLSILFSCRFFLEKQALLSTIRSVLLLP